MSDFLGYVSQVEALVTEVLNVSDWHLCEAYINNTLNSGPSRELRKHFDINQLRKVGAFFTGEELAQELLVEEKMTLLEADKILDPACGAGDLLLACVKHLPLSDDRRLASTLDAWGNKLMGFDINSSFIRLAKARLVLAAIKKGAITGAQEQVNLDTIFPYLRVQDGLYVGDLLKDVSVVIMNPPFSYTETPNECRHWTSGKVSLASVFVAKYATTMMPGTRIVAILPEVLRTGRRYTKWRYEIEQLGTGHEITPVGLFDKSVDINVFVLRLNVGSRRETEPAVWWEEEQSSKLASTISAFFDVHVGPVVPHRDPEKGPVLPFIHARSVSAWGIVSEIKQTRKFNGKAYTPPFVVIRRTSRPDDDFRAVGSIVNTDSPVAVENHLLILLPKDKSMSTCEKLLQHLKSKQSNNWLNERIRCRHLTVASIAAMPLPWGVKGNL